MSKRKKGPQSPRSIAPTVTPPTLTKRPNGGRREPKVNRQEAA